MMQKWQQGNYLTSPIRYELDLLLLDAVQSRIFLFTNLFQIYHFLPFVE